MLIPMCGFKALLPLSQSLPSNTPEEGYCLLLNSLNTSPLLTARNTVHLLMCQSIEGGQLPFWVRKRELYLWRGKSVCQAPLVAQTVKNPPAVQETWVQFLGWKDPLEEDPTPGHSPVWQPTPVFLPGESPWTEESGRLWSMGLQRVRQDKESEIYMSVFINNRFLLY